MKELFILSSKHLAQKFTHVHKTRKTHMQTTILVADRHFKSKNQIVQFKLAKQQSDLDKTFEAQSSSFSLDGLLGSDLSILGVSKILYLLKTFI